MLRASDSTPWIVTATACRLLGISRQRLYQLQSEGKLVGRQMDSRWVWNRNSVEARAGQLALPEG